MPSLSPREIECLLHAAKGGTSKEIARGLAISARTVEQYLLSARLKLGARTLPHAVAMAVSRGLVDVGCKSLDDRQAVLPVRQEQQDQ